MRENFSPEGEADTGFSKGGERGPFSCGNCIHMSGDICQHPEITRNWNLDGHQGQRPVDKQDFCRYVRRPEKATVGRILKEK